MMEVEQSGELIHISRMLTALLHEFSSITVYRTLRDSIPQRLAIQLKCRCVLLYFQHEETLQLVASYFDEHEANPDSSSSLVSFAHMNPLSIHSGAPEACAWREHRLVAIPDDAPTFVAAPLIYRQRSIGVLVVVRRQGDLAC